MKQSSSLDQTVKLYPELSCAALKAKLGKQLCLWYELRGIDVSGSNRLDVDIVLAALVPRVYSKATFYRILNSGDGQLWNLYYVSKPYTHLKVQIVGAFNVAKLFKVPYLSRPRAVPLPSFVGRKLKRAQLYASFFKPDGFKSKPISRASLQAVTGVCRRSQIRYDKAAGTKRVANFAFHSDGRGGYVPIVEFLNGKVRRYLTVRRLGNAYHSAAMIASRGMTKRVNHQLKHSSLEVEGVPQRFFISAKTLLKCQDKAPEAFLLIPPRDRRIRGRLEWCLA